MFTEVIGLLGFSFGITGPIFLLVIVGVFLKALKLIDESFVKEASKLTFRVAFPALLFFNLAQSDIQEVAAGSLLSFGLSSTLIIFIILSFLAHFFVKRREDRGIFIQGAFRGELIIIGFAFSYLAYGDLGLARASIYMSLMVFLYNFLSILALTFSLSEQRSSASSYFAASAKNPIMVSIVLGSLVSLIGIPMPEMVLLAGDSLASMALPLALICIGASISFSEYKNSSGVSLGAVAFKLLAAPILVLFLAQFWTLDKVDLGVLFFMASAPTTSASYVMAQAMGGNGKLAANIVVISTMGSIFTVSFGLAIIKLMGIV